MENLQESVEYCRIPAGCVHRVFTHLVWLPHSGSFRPLLQRHSFLGSEFGKVYSKSWNPGNVIPALRFSRKWHQQKDVLFWKSRHLLFPQKSFCGFHWVKLDNHYHVSPCNCSAAEEQKIFWTDVSRTSSGIRRDGGRKSSLLLQPVPGSGGGILNRFKVVNIPSWLQQWRQWYQIAELLLPAGLVTASQA